MSTDLLSNLLHSYIIGSDEKIIKLCIGRTGNDVMTVTKSFSYIIHCNCEIEYLQNAKCYRDGIWCSIMSCQAELVKHFSKA